MTLTTFFQKFDQFADAPDAVKKMLAPLPGCAFRLRFHPVVSLRSTTGYRLESLRDGRRGFSENDAATDPNTSLVRPRFVHSSDAEGIPVAGG